MEMVVSWVMWNQKRRWKYTEISPPIFKGAMAEPKVISKLSQIDCPQSAKLLPLLPKNCQPKHGESQPHWHVSTTMYCSNVVICHLFLQTWTLDSPQDCGQKSSNRKTLAKINLDSKLLSYICNARVGGIFAPLGFSLHGALQDYYCREQIASAWRWFFYKRIFCVMKLVQIQSCSLLKSCYACSFAVFFNVNGDGPGRSSRWRPSQTIPRFQLSCNYWCSLSWWLNAYIYIYIYMYMCVRELMNGAGDEHCPSFAAEISAPFSGNRSRTAIKNAANRSNHGGSCALDFKLRRLRQR